MHIFIFDSTTGKLLRCASGESELIQGLSSSNEIEVQVTEENMATVVAQGLESYRLDCNNVIQKIVPKSSAFHIFNYETTQWEDPRTLQDFKDEQWTLIKQARTQAEFGTFIYNGMEFDGDLDAQRRLASYISVSKSAIASGMPFQAEFILANNSVVLLTAQDFVGIEMAKVQQVAEAFAHAVQLRARIDAATTKEEVEAVVW